MADPAETPLYSYHICLKKNWTGDLYILCVEFVDWMNQTLFFKNLDSQHYAVIRPCWFAGTACRALLAAPIPLSTIYSLTAVLSDHTHSKSLNTQTLQHPPVLFSMWHLKVKNTASAVLRVKILLLQFCECPLGSVLYVMLIKIVIDYYVVYYGHWYYIIYIVVGFVRRFRF